MPLWNLSPWSCIFHISCITFLHISEICNARHSCLWPISAQTGSLKKSSVLISEDERQAAVVSFWFFNSCSKIEQKSSREFKFGPCIKSTNYEKFETHHSSLKFGTIYVLLSHLLVSIWALLSRELLEDCGQTAEHRGGTVGGEKVSKLWGFIAN